VKLAGRSDVTMVWASAPLAERVTVETNATSSETAKRCEDIMTYLPRIPAKPAADRIGRMAVPELSAPMRILHPEQTPFGGEPQHRTPRRQR
jgi:hypothetical protein